MLCDKPYLSCFNFLLKRFIFESSPAGIIHLQTLMISYQIQSLFMLIIQQYSQTCLRWNHVPKYMPDSPLSEPGATNGTSCRKQNARSKSILNFNKDVNAFLQPKMLFDENLNQHRSTVDLYLIWGSRAVYPLKHKILFRYSFDLEKCDTWNIFCISDLLVKYIQIRTNT